MHGEVFDEKATVLKNFEDAGFDTDAQVIGYLKTYGFEEELIYSPVGNLSGGEKNLLQLAKISRTDANLLLLDEPTSHLDTYSQLALEDAIEKYNGTVLMVSHDFYTVANCMDYVLPYRHKGLRALVCANLQDDLCRPLRQGLPGIRAEEKRPGKPHCLCPPGHKHEDAKQVSMII